MADVRVAEWQHRLDRQFPRGAVAGWSGVTGTVYQIPRILVLRIGSGGLPVVLMPVFSGSDKVLGPYRITSYQRTGPRTGGPVSQVTFSGDARVMTWNPRVSERLARLMAPERDLFMALAPDGGRAAQHTPEEP